MLSLVCRTPFSEPYEIYDDDMRESMYNHIELYYSFELLTTNIISFKSIESVFYSGTAHPNYLSTGFNYWLNPVSEISLQLLLDNCDAALLILYELCKKKLITEAIKRNIIDKYEDSFFIQGAFTPEWETFNNFCIKNDMMSFIFIPYHITPYALGVFIVDICFEEIISLLPNAKTLIKINDVINMRAHK